MSINRKSIAGTVDLGATDNAVLDTISSNTSTTNTVLGSLFPVKHATNAVYADGHDGYVALTVRTNTPTTLTEGDGDYSTLRVDSVGRLWTSVGDIPGGDATRDVINTLPASENVEDFDTLTVSSTAVSLSDGGLGAVPTGAVYAYIQAEGGDVRFRDDGTAPTSSVGTRLFEDTEIKYIGELNSIQFIRAGGVDVTLAIRYVS